MRYFGGKQRISKPMAEFINSILKDDQPFVDAFCGSCNVISKINPDRHRVANDYHHELIEMWKALQAGWEPPENVSEQEYYTIKEGGFPEEKAFVGFGCSYSGKYWGGYARGGENRNYAKNAYNSTMKKMKTLFDVEFTHGSYQDIILPADALVYCDIPYKDTTGYSTGSFDHEEFYEWARNTPNVIVSEYAKNVPEGSTIIWAHKSKKDIRNKQGVQEPTEEVIFTFDNNINREVQK